MTEKSTWSFRTTGLFGLIFACGLVGGVFAATMFLTDRRPSSSVLSNCGVASGKELVADRLRIRCGLDQAAIDALIEEALRQFQLSGIRPEDADTDRLRAMAADLGLTLDAARSLIGRANGRDEETRSIPVALEVATDTQATPAAGRQSDRSEASEGLVETSTPRFAVDVGSTSSAIEREAEALVVAAECGAAAGDGIEIRLVDIECGPEPEEIEKLIATFSEQSGIGSLRDAISADTDARKQFVSNMSKALNLEEATVARLLGELDDVAVDEDGLRRRLSGELRTRMTRALALFRMRQGADRLAEAHRLAAHAAASGDMMSADASMRAAGTFLRPVIDDLAPVEHPTLVRAAMLAEQARTLGQNGKSRAAAINYYDAAEIARGLSRHLADSYVLEAADQAERAGRNGGDPQMVDWAIETRLNLADSYGWIAADLLIDAADGLLEKSEQTLGLEDIERAEREMRELIPFIESKAEPLLVGRFSRRLSGILLEKGKRTGRDDALTVALQESTRSVDALEGNGSEIEVARSLNQRGNVQWNLGRRRKDLNLLDAAVADFERASAIYKKIGHDGGVRIVDNNLAGVNLTRGDLTGDSAYLEEAVQVYRRLAEGADPETDAGRWALYKNNLGIVQQRLGNADGNVATLRQAERTFSEVLEVRTLEVSANDWFTSSRSLAQVAHDIARHSENAEQFQAAAGLFDEIISVLSPMSEPKRFSDLLRDRSRTYYDWGRLSSDPEKLELALSDITRAEMISAGWVTASEKADTALYKAGTLIERELARQGPAQRDFTEARASLDAATAILEGSGAAMPPAEKSRLDSWADRLQATLRRHAPDD